MTPLLHLTLVAVFIISPQTFISGNATQNQTGPQRRIQIDHNLTTDMMTARLIRFRVGGAKAHYHTLDLSAVYTYQGKNRRHDTIVNVELLSVVKARKLNPDLYVVFDVDGREVHFSSSRSAIRKPRPRSLMDRRTDGVLIPTAEFEKLSTAKKLAIKMGPVRFDLDEDGLEALKVFAETIKRLGS